MTNPTSIQIGTTVRVGSGRTDYRVDGITDGMASIYPRTITRPSQSRTKRVAINRLRVVV